MQINGKFTSKNSGFGRYFSCDTKRNPDRDLDSNPCLAAKIPGRKAFSLQQLLRIYRIPLRYLRRTSKSAKESPITVRTEALNGLVEDGIFTPTSYPAPRILERLTCQMLQAYKKSRNGCTRCKERRVKVRYLTFSGARFYPNIPYQIRAKAWL